MLLENLIKETLDLQGFRVESVTRSVIGLLVQIVADRRFKPRCGVCGRSGTYRDRRAERLFRHMPVLGIPVLLIYAPRRVHCPACGGIHVEELPWSTGKRRLTQPFACCLAAWARLLPWADVARLFKCSWGTVASAVHFVVSYGLAHRDLSGITHIGIDEISRKKGHVYLTNVYDLNTRTVLWSGEGRSRDTLTRFFVYLGKERASQLRGICCDMWDPYIQVIRQYAPQAVLVFDKFHIVRHLMDAVDHVRRQEMREQEKAHKDLLKGTRYLWLKNPWNLTEKQQARFSLLEKLNLKINRAYLLKEAFRDFWDYTSRAWAEKYLNQWLWWATHSRLNPFRDFAGLIKRHKENILSYFRMPITNAGVEGLNNKAKVISHRAYGFRSAKTYILNLYNCMGGLPVPEHMHTFV
jgi:transposase